MRRNIFVHIELETPERARLEGELPDDARFYFRQDRPEKEWPHIFNTSHICFGNPPLEWIGKDCTLQWLQLESAGFGEYLGLPGDLLKITNLKGMFGTPVAETAVAGILGIFRSMNELTLLQKEKIWKGLLLRPSLRTIHGSKACIIGGGSIGLTIKKILKGCGAKVVVMGKRSPDADIRTVRELELELPRTDMVISCLPETPETIGYFDRHRLDLLSKNAVFVNVGRGSAVDEEHLIEKLQNGQLAGAVLDVTDKEPLPSDHPLWECPNTILTQHTGGGYNMENMDKITIFLSNYKRFIEGQELINLVSLEKGY